MRFLGLFALPLASALVSPVDSVGRLPALGWNSWNAFGCDINETRILDAAHQMVSRGLLAAGYQFVNLDDCWSDKRGRDAAGKLVPDPTKFPNGIAGLADKVHALGLQLGIYSSAGTTTCAGYPASLGYEAVDAQTWADWGVDYLKYDNCGVPRNWTDVCQGCVPDASDGKSHPNGTCPGTTNLCPTGYNYSSSHTAERYRHMRDALLAQKRPILYSLCDWGAAGVQSWGNATGHSWRATPDIRPRWSKVVGILNQNSFYLDNTDFWGHSDADMLEVGNKGLSLAEARTHFAFWAAMKSPLLIGTDLTTLTDVNRDILTNKWLLQFNQDLVVGAPAKPYKWGTNPDGMFNETYPAEYWSGRFGDGRVLVLALNPYATTKTKIITWSEVPELKGSSSSTSIKVTDAWTGKDLGTIQDSSLSANVSSHDTAVFVVQTVVNH
ncbi:hypothetical protein SEUCBS139899_000900 [Sporothrix eucalyptigena]|uniref:Alpha-galactosidase n=1 Tax=Sporothrix eucalyptigena TaxID=1812306 RepID=A0ABP0BJY8_9PEZI